MAKRSKALPARKSARSREDDSVLIRTAESLGRMIGSLQRQLQDATTRMSDAGDKAFDALPELPQLDDVFGREKKPARASSSARGGTKKKKTKTARKPTKARKVAVATDRRPGVRGAGRTRTAPARSRKSSRNK
jgi:hypothetical protein